MCILPAWTEEHHTWLVPMETLDPLELELQMLVSHNVGTVNVDTHCVWGRDYFIILFFSEFIRKPGVAKLLQGP